MKGRNSEVPGTSCNEEINEAWPLSQVLLGVTLRAVLNSKVLAAWFEQKPSTPVLKIATIKYKNTHYHFNTHLTHFLIKINLSIFTLTQKKKKKINTFIK